MYREKLRYTFVTIEEQLPLIVESVGFNPVEQDFVRPEGYPYYHWLQTYDGKGRFVLDGKEHQLSPGQGILLKPYTPHSYFSIGPAWSTMYVTFSGASAVSIIDSLKLSFSTIYTETDDVPFAMVIKRMLEATRESSEFSKLEMSALMYEFLINLKKYGKINNQPSLSHYYDKVRPLVEWLETAYGEDIGLDDMASELNISPQYLNRLFRETFSMSPYQFLIQLRIRKSKEILIQNPEFSLDYISFLVGFHDVSHFISTFKKKESITPNKYRALLVKRREASKQQELILNGD